MADIHDKVADLVELLMKAPRTRTELYKLTGLGHRGVDGYTEAFTRAGLCDRVEHRTYVEYTWRRQ